MKMSDYLVNHRTQFAKIAALPTVFLPAELEHVQH